MMEHGPDLGTAEFIFAKGGNLADFNYVMFNVNDSTYEPLIKAVAERDNTHPDLIRKNVVPLPQTQPQQRALAAPQNPGIAVDQQTVVGANPRAVRQFNQAVDAQQRGEAVRGGSQNVGDLYGAGFRGRAAAQGVRNVMGVAGAGAAAAGGLAGAAGRAAGRAAGAAGRGIGRGAQRMMESGAAQRMGRFMGNLRHIPEAARGAMEDRRERNLDENRRRLLETKRGRAQADVAALSRQTGTNTQARDSMHDDAERQLASANKELGEVEERLGRERPSLAQRVRNLGQQRRGEQLTPEQQARREEEAAGRLQDRTNAASEGLPEDPEDAITPEEPTVPDLPFDDDDDEQEPVEQGPVETAPPGDGAVAPQASPAVEVQTPDIDPRIARFDALAAKPEGEGGQGYGSSSIGGKTSSYSKFRDRLMQQGIDPDDPSTITQAALDAAKIPKSNAARAFIERLKAKNPALVQAAAQGDTAAAQEIEEAAEEAGVTEDPLGGFAMSEDKHIASWDSLLKGLNIR